MAAASFCLALQPYQLDDAYIVYRYAAQWVATGRLAFNSGGPIVEGFSSPAWFTLLSASASVLGPRHLPQTAALLGFVSHVGVIALAARLCAAAKADALGTALRAVMLLWIALIPPALFYATTGLEQPLFLACVLAVVAGIEGRIPTWAGVLAAVVAPWTRPEAPVLLPMIAALVLGRRMVNSSGRPIAVPWAVCSWIVSALLGSVFGLWVVRWSWFGSLVPNTYFAKQPDLTEGLFYIGGVLSTPWAAAAIVVAGLAATYGGGVARGRLLAALLWLGVAAAEGGDWMPVGRLAGPSLLLLLTSALALAERSGRGPSRRAQIAAMVIAAVGIVAAVHANREVTSISISELESISHEQRYLARWLRDADARSVALVDIGELGYETGLEIVDLAGLTDAVIARAPGGHLSKRFDLSYLFSRRRPHVIVLRLDSPPHRDDARVLEHVGSYALSPVERAIARDARLASEYHIAFSLLPADMRTPYYGRVVYLRTDFAPAVPLPRRITYLTPLELD